MQCRLPVSTDQSEPPVHRSGSSHRVSARLLSLYTHRRAVLGEAGSEVIKGGLPLASSETFLLTFLFKTQFLFSCRYFGWSHTKLPRALLCCEPQFLEMAGRPLNLFVSPGTVSPVLHYLRFDAKLFSSDLWLYAGHWRRNLFPFPFSLPLYPTAA